MTFEEITEEKASMNVKKLRLGISLTRFEVAINRKLPKKTQRSRKRFFAPSATIPSSSAAGSINYRRKHPKKANFALHCG
jgi:hypothetical protein